MSSLPLSKICSKCGIDKPLEEFSKGKNRKDGKRSYCRECSAKYNRQYRKNNPDRDRQYYQDNRERLSAYSKQRYAANPEFFKEKSRRWYAQNTEQALEAGRRWREQNPEVARESRRRWVKQNPERKREIGRRWRESNSELIKQRNRAQHQQNPEIARERLRRWRRNNPELAKERNRQWGRSNPEYARAKVLARRARKLALPDNFTVEHMQICLEYFNNTCAYCGNQFVDLFGNTKRHFDHFIPLSADNCPGTVPENMLCTCSACNTSKQARPADEWLKQRFGTRKANQILRRIQAYFDSLAS